MKKSFLIDNEIKAIAKVAFPNYSGRKFAVKVATRPIDVRSCWEGGSRTYFNFVRLDTMQPHGEVGAQSAFDAQIKGADSVNLVSGLVCVQHSYFCGKDMGITIMVHPDNAPRLLPITTELTEDEKIVILIVGNN